MYYNLKSPTLISSVNIYFELLFLCIGMKIQGKVSTMQLTSVNQGKYHQINVGHIEFQ